MKMDDSTLVQAEKEFAARQAAMKAPFKSRPPRAEAKQDRRWMLYLGAPLVLGMLATLGFALRLDGAKRPGRIVVTPSPSVGADLFIDNQHAGRLPPFVHSVAAGTHRVEVRARGYKPFSTEVLVPSGGRPMEIDAQLAPDGPMQLEGVVLTQPRPEHIAERVKLVMRPAESPKTSQPKNGAMVARLRIVTEPAGAEVRVDGKVVGTSPVTTGPLDPGPYHPVIATLDGYAPARRAAKLDPTGTTEVSLFFEMEAPRLAEAAPVPSAAVGYLTAATKPAARLTIDGRDTGRWTPVPAANPIALPPGAHTLLFETADGRKLEEQFEIEPGKTSRVIRSLP
jgi:hypothetical protein